MIDPQVRSQLVASLAKLPDGEPLSFTRLQDMLGVTPGNLITHLRKLKDAGYIRTEKAGSGAVWCTAVTLTPRGRAALDAYTETLSGLLDGRLTPGERRWAVVASRVDLSVKPVERGRSK